MKPISTADIVAMSALAATCVGTLVIYPFLPDLIPVHFDWRGVADGFAPKLLGAWLIPGITLPVWLLIRFGGRLLPAEWQRRLEQSPIDHVGSLLNLFMGSIQAVIVYAALFTPPNVAGVFGLLMSAFWIAMGLVMPRVRRNPWIGIRTTWTLSSDENWAKTHRFSGQVFVATGAVGLLMALVGLSSAVFVLIIASSIVCLLYSYMLAREQSA